MEGSSFGVNQTTFAKVVHVLEFVSIKASGNIDPFAPETRSFFILKLQRIDEDMSNLL